MDGVRDVNIGIVIASTRNAGYFSNLPGMESREAVLNQKFRVLHTTRGERMSAI